MIFSRNDRYFSTQSSLGNKMNSKEEEEEEEKSFRNSFVTFNEIKYMRLSFRV